MTHIRPVSDLRNKYREIEDIVKNGEPVFLTENGYTTMVLLSRYFNTSKPLNCSKTA